MIELEVYAPGVRNMDKILELDHALEADADVRYKVDSNHDIVYFEFDTAEHSVEEILAVFQKLDITAKVVGAIPPEINPRSITQSLGKNV